MSKISAVIIAKNEEDMIADCLESVSFCDEIIVVDGGSTDRTAQIARHMKAKVVEVRMDSFSHMRNAGLEKAKGEWVLYVDADERVSQVLQDEITHLIYNSGRVKLLNAYFVNRKNFYLGNHEWPYIEKIERLFKREKLKMWKGRIHESPIFEGEAGEINGYLIHLTHRNFTSMLDKTIIWSEIEADLRIKASHPKMAWWRFPRVMVTAFFDSYVRQKGWKIGTVGLIESMYQAFSMFITYARLWELQQEKK